MTVPWGERYTTDRYPSRACQVGVACQVGSTGGMYIRWHVGGGGGGSTGYVWSGMSLCAGHRSCSG